MSARHLFSVSTALDRERVWALFSDIQNWVNCSDVYECLTWGGSPWAINSSIGGRVRHNRNERVRYVVERYEPGRLVTYIGHSDDSGFASHRTIRFLDREDGGTLIELQYFTVASPESSAVGEQFVRWLTERWIDGFARYCDAHAGSLSTAMASRQ
jgi:hypothetical protein